MMIFGNIFTYYIASKSRPEPMGNIETNGLRMNLCKTEFLSFKP